MKLSLTLLGAALASTVLAGSEVQTTTDLKEIFDSGNCLGACTFLGAVLWGKVHFPVSSVYKAQQGLLWSQQVRDVTPVCRVAPTNALDVSTALLILRTTGCQFAVKGGGHTPFVGANTIEKGVTIDLINLSDVKLVKNNAELQVGGGAKWGQVYPVLDSKNLRVIGGRASDVGVGGLTTGGGISFFSARYGFACDNVNTFQVVFADGTIREVTKDRYPDVYWALRGGSNNFGIVTRFDLQTYPGGNMWGGIGQSPMDGTLVPSLTALSNLAERQSEDPDSAAIVGIVYVPAYQLWLSTIILTNANAIENPPALKNFTDIPLYVSNTRRVTTLTGLTDEISSTQPNGQYQNFFTLTLKNDVQTMIDISAIFQEEINKIATTEGFLPTLNFQAFSKATTAQFAKNGGNALGLSPADGPLINLNIAAGWSKAADSAAVNAACQKVIERAKTLAKSRNTFHPYLYLNYADISQKADVFPGYGAANLQRLINIHRQYDPNNVFVDLSPGGFKIPK